MKRAMLLNELVKYKETPFIESILLVFFSISKRRQHKSRTKSGKRLNSLENGWLTDFRFLPFLIICFCVPYSRFVVPCSGVPYFTANHQIGGRKFY